ncbi:MAG TPA: TetR-like C-terminal domain-containing protein [Nocardioidaceae bacterium]|jgi:AcrR family transcriptional regulator
MTATGTEAPLTRRERQRQATYDEIVDVSRRLIAAGDGLSLRAVAAEMGMTAPALYRYVDSYQELVLLVARSIYADVLATLVSARNTYPDDDPGAQVVASAVAFRTWALRHRAEFALLFANPAVSREEGSHPDEDSAAFANFFGDIYRRLWNRYGFAIPTDDELHPEALRSLLALREAGSLPCDFPGMPIGMSWIFIRAWNRLYGTVTLEVFKHMDSGVVSSGALFRAMLEDNGRDLDFGADWSRLLAVADTEMAADAEVT